MLAPRKKLWSTPQEVILTALELLQPDASDVVYDIGCGEGRFLQACCERTSAQRVIGVEIDADRAELARSKLRSSGLEPPRCCVETGNALECNFSDGTCFFLYLIPRGLKLILPLLQSISHPIRVVTYMSPLPGVAHLSSAKVNTATHPDAQWPLFYYELSPPLP